MTKYHEDSHETNPGRNVARLGLLCRRPQRRCDQPRQRSHRFAQAFNASFVAGDLFDGARGTDCASQGGGAGDPFSTTNGTWIEFDFGSAVTMDRMVVISRNNTAGIIGTSRLIFSNDATFDSSDTIFTVGAHGNAGSGPVLSFSQTSGQYLRWEVATSTGTAQNLGGIEMRFLNTPPAARSSPSPPRSICCCPTTRPSAPG